MTDRPPVDIGRERPVAPEAVKMKNLNVVCFAPNRNSSAEVETILQHHDRLDHVDVLSSADEVIRRINKTSSFQKDPGVDVVVITYSSLNYDPKVPPNLQIQEEIDFWKVMDAIGQKDEKISNDLNSAGKTDTNKLLYREGIPVIVVGDIDKIGLSKVMSEMMIDHKPQHVSTSNKSRLISTGGNVNGPGLLDKLADRKQMRLSKLKPASMGGD